LGQPSEFKKLTLFSTPHCERCKTIKKLLDDKKLLYETIDLMNDPEKDIYIAKYNMRSVPKLLVNDELLEYEEILKQFSQQEVKQVERYGNYSQVLEGNIPDNESENAKNYLTND